MFDDNSQQNNNKPQIQINPNEVFLSIEVDKNKAYVGEQIKRSVNLYVAERVANHVTFSHKDFLLNYFYQ